MRSNNQVAPDLGLPSGTATFLLTDIAGSTAAWERARDAMASAVTRHYELIDEIVAINGGVRPVEQGEGDSTVSVFRLAPGAIAAALSLQRAFAAEPWPAEADIRLRIALHTGTVDRRDDGNYFGLTVIRCARLRDVGHGGQTLISAATRSAVEEDLPPLASLRPLGSYRLKDLGRVERVWQLCHPDLDGDFPPLRSLDVVPNNLPLRLTTFLGREAELADLAQVVATSRLVTLTGAGGSGKTALALHLAAETADRHADGTWWVELGSVSDPAMVPHAVAAVIGLRKEPGRPLVDTIGSQLRDQETLIVLDNCEHVIDAVATLADGVLSAAPNLRVVTTTREPLGIAGEVSWRVPSLDEAAAVRLFVERATEVRRGFQPAPDERDVIARICRRLDGLPLAIELAAARVRMMHPARIADALDDRFRLLTGGSRSSLPRQRTLEASVAWSYDLLDETERTLLRRLSVFADGFTLEAAEIVCSDGVQVDRYSVLDLLSRLIDKSLVQDDGATDTRYRLLETIRHYAGAQLVASGEADHLRLRHLHWCVELAERTEPMIPRADGPAWLARLEQDHANFRVALEWGDDTGHRELVLRLAGALAPFWELRGHHGSGSRWLARALGHDDEPSAVRARALAAAAHMGIYGSDLGSSVRHAPVALAMADAAGDERTALKAANTLAYLDAIANPVAARARLVENVARARSIGDDWALADALKMTTITWAVQEDFDGLLESAQDLYEVAVRLENAFYLAWYHSLLGYMGFQQGDLTTARHELERAMTLCAQVGDPSTGWLASAHLAALDARCGLYADARARFAEVLGRAAATGGGVGCMTAVPLLAELLVGLGDTDAADQLIGTHADELRAGPPHLASAFCTSWAALLALAGDHDRAVALAREARAWAVRLGNPVLTSAADHRLGCLARQHGLLGQAEDLHHAALAARHRHRLLPSVPESLEAIAGIASHQGSALEAVRLFAAADRARNGLGCPRWPSTQADFDADLGSTRELLDDAAFATAWAEGTALDLDQAVAFASRARGERKRPPAGWESLTPTELEVVRLAAEGLSNPEIGERLFIGRGTVKTHLSHIFTKLGISNRAELAAQATRRDIATRPT